MRLFAPLFLLLSGCAIPSPSDPPSSQPVSIGSALSIDEFLSAEYPDLERSQIRVTTVDLDDDENPEYLVWLKAPAYCGTGGCSLHIFKPGVQDWSQIGRIPAINAPYGVLPTKTDGWFDLYVTLRGGGGPHGSYRVRRIDEQYGPSKLPPSTERIESLVSLLGKPEP